jgi:hypothetical protein
MLMYLGSNVEMGLRKVHRNSNDSFSQIRGQIYTHYTESSTVKPRYTNTPEDMLFSLLCIVSQ